jgi:glycosyltransferase involved in cell wall biosynthesis
MTPGGVYGPKLQALGATVTFLDMGSPTGLLRGFVQLWRLFRELRPSVVQTWMYHADLIGGVAARLAGRPVFWGVRHSNLDRAKNKRSTLWVAGACAVLSSWIPRRIVSCSKRAIGVHVAFGYADRFTYVPNGLDLAGLVDVVDRRNAVRESLNIAPGEQVIGHVGRFHAQKDYPTLLTAFQQLATQSPWLLLAGKGLTLDNPAFVELCGDCSERVIALGVRDDIPSLLSAMDLFVLSSVGEGFPNAVAEAMACGVPCVVTDVGDAADIVEESGWVVRPGDPADLAAAIDAALAEPCVDRATRRSYARQRIEDNFSIQRMVSGYEAVWAEAQGS